MGRWNRDRDQPFSGWDYIRFCLLAVPVFGLTYLAMSATLWGEDLDGSLVGRSAGWGVVMGIVWILVTRHQQRAKAGAAGGGIGSELCRTSPERAGKRGDSAWLGFGRGG